MNRIQVQWTDIKSFVDSREVPIQWLETTKDYFLYAFDGIFAVETRLSKNPTDTTDLTDFETNYKNESQANKSPSPEDFVIKAVKNKFAYTITTSLVSVDSNNEKDLVLLKNPSGSGKRLLATHFKFGTDSSNVRSLVRVYANPTVTTNGTALGLINTYIGDSVPTSLAEAYSFPTISDRGQVLNLDINPSDSPSKGLNRYYWVEPNHSLLVTVENSSSNAKTFADIYWLEGL